VLFGNGVVANVVLARTKGNTAGWVVIIGGWGVAVFVVAFCSAPFSRAHLNPAVTLATAIAGKLPVAQIVPYVTAHARGDHRRSAGYQSWVHWSAQRSRPRCKRSSSSKRLL